MKSGLCPKCETYSALGWSRYIGLYTDRHAWVCLDCHIEAEEKHKRGRNA